MRNISMVLVILVISSACAKVSPQQTYFDLLKGKMLSTVASVGKGGVRSGETKVDVGVQVTLPGMEELSMGEMSMDKLSMPEVSSNAALHLCSDSSYIATFEAKTMGIKSSGRETGTWAIGKASSAGFALILTDKGSKATKALSVSFDGERTMVDDERWDRSKSTACK